MTAEVAADIVHLVDEFSPGSFRDFAAGTRSGAESGRLPGFDSRPAPDTRRCEGER